MQKKEALVGHQPSRGGDVTPVDLATRWIDDLVRHIVITLCLIVLVLMHATRVMPHTGA